jgi:outer membrane protein assembly factor BamA
MATLVLVVVAAASPATGREEPQAPGMVEGPNADVEDVPIGGEDVPTGAEDVPGGAETVPTRGDSCMSGPVRAVRVDGCEFDECSTPGFIDQILGVADLSPGDSLDASTRKAIAGRLQRLGFFHEVGFRCFSVSDGVDVAIEVDGVARLRKLKVTGHSHFYESQILDRIAIMRGDRMDPRDPATLESLERIRDTIQRAYQEEGFTGTEVDLDFESSDFQNVDLTIKVTEGERVKIAKLDIGLRPSDSAATSGVPDAEGCPVVRSKDLKRWSGLTVGKVVTERTETETIRSLTRTLRSIGFAGVSVGFRFDAKSRRLEIDATYDSCHLLRFYLRDRALPGRLGFKPMTDESLLESLPFGDSGVFDLTEADLGREEVRIWFENRGYILADVVLDYRTASVHRDDSLWAEDPLDQGAGDVFGPNVRGRIAYYVTRNDRVEIRGIRIIGNSAVSASRIRDAMATKTYDFFGDPGAVLPDQVFYDLDRIQALYLDEGFRDIRFKWSEPGQERVRRFQREGRFDVYTFASDDRGFRMVKPPDTEGVYLEIGVEEGPRTMLGAVTVEGVSAMSPRVLDSILGLKSGGAFSANHVRTAVNRLQRRYGSEGYLRTEVKVSCEGHDPEVPRDECDLDTFPSRVVDLFVDVQEGMQTRVGQVFVEGTDRTLDSTVLKDFPQPGDPYDVERVARAVRWLNDLGIFVSVRVNPVGTEESPPREMVALVIECRESRSRFVDFVAGFEKLDDSRSGNLPGYVTSALSQYLSLTDISTTGYGSAVKLLLPDILFTLEARYTDLNFLGRAKRIYIPLKYGLSTTAWDRYAAFTPTYVDPRFFLRGLSFRVTPFGIYDRATTRLDQIEFGAEVAVSKELVPRLYGSLAFETAGVRIRDPAQSTEYEPWGWENKVSPSLTYDRLDHPIHPKNGGYLQASLAYINTLREGNFLKYEVLAKGFVTIRRLVTVAVTGRAGGSVAFGTSRSLPLNERFSLGGNRGVRGFSTDGVGQYNPDGSLRLDSRVETRKGPDGEPIVDENGDELTDVVYVKPYGGDVAVSGTLELRFPILKQLDLHGAVFYDFGALAEQWSEMNPKSVRHSAGIGLRFLLGGVVPIRLDYGFILDRRCRDVDRSTGACVGREEVGNVHFGILYTF